MLQPLPEAQGPFVIPVQAWSETTLICNNQNVQIQGTRVIDIWNALKHLLPRTTSHVWRCNDKGEQTSLVFPYEFARIELDADGVVRLLFVTESVFRTS